MIQRYHGEEVVPKRLRLNADTLALAAEVIALFCAPQGRTRGELEAERQVPEGDQTDYRLKRGLAHLLESAFSPYERRSPLDPAEWRQRAFALSAPSAPSAPPPVPPSDCASWVARSNPPTPKTVPLAPTRPAL